MVKRVSKRSSWKLMGCKEYICPFCKRDKGMIYLFKDGSLRYVCFCGVNIKINSIQNEYNFKTKEFIKSENFKLGRSE